ncbi:hypothetical protein PT2222_150128 [Paraburkholderia tropica]
MGKRVPGSNAKPNISRPAASPARFASTPRRNSRMPPEAMLSMPDITSINALGSKSNRIAATHTPPIAESTIKLRRSPRYGTAHACAARRAICGQIRQSMTSSTQNGAPRPCCTNTDAMQKNASTRPPTRNRQLRSTKRLPLPAIGFVLGNILGLSNVLLSRRIYACIVPSATAFAVENSGFPPENKGYSMRAMSARSMPAQPRVRPCVSFLMTPR